MQNKKIAIVEDDSLLRQQIVFALSKEYRVTEASDRVKGEAMLKEENPDLALVDLNLPPSGKTSEGMKLIEQIKRSDSDTVVIVMSGNADMKTVWKAIEAGAYDYFKKPFDLAELKLIIRRALEKQEIERENGRLRQALAAEERSFQDIVGKSPAMKKIYDAIKRVAGSTTTVIVRGESGTGKELIARAIHAQSKRSHQPFISVNCAALPETLVESELFGHERGAFTGAVAARAGRFELAHGGTLFLDEIGAVSQAVQAKLLRVLEERSFERVGGSKQIQADVRLVTATNEDLEKKVAEGQFREDLYYRINVFSVVLPPLRERREDIPLLLDHFLRAYCAENNVPPKTLEPAALQALLDHPWKGNVREMENLTQTLVLMCDDSVITTEHLPSYMLGFKPAGAIAEIPAEGLSLEKAVEQFERDLIQTALRKAGSVKTKAASLLQIDKNQMKYLCRKYKL